MNFNEFFEIATGHAPFPYQERLATLPEFPEVVDIPTGLGKTAAVILAWAWRRRHHPDLRVRQQTPRRLIYCLPMRVLVGQTYAFSVEAMGKLGLLAGRASMGEHGELTDYRAGSEYGKIGVWRMMGGALDSSWERAPDQESIIIGTQDQLLSRALNRGYAMSRFKWPVHFSFLHNDALWVMDETQLMGVGLETTAQLEAFRRRFSVYGNSASLWMSATLDDGGLKTVDFNPPPQEEHFRLDDSDRRVQRVMQRTNAAKIVRKSEITVEKGQKGYGASVAEEAVNHHQPGSLTLIVVNRVVRAQEIFSALQKLLQNHDDAPVLGLIHARMRGKDRKSYESMLGPIEETPGRIIVATQALEAGIDVSACTLITELAPWPSLVQRFGRCNRYGEFEAGSVRWIDINATGEKDDVILPYSKAELDQARKLLLNIENASPQELREAGRQFAPPKRRHAVIRGKDLHELFDTTPDLTGNDLDVSRYIRDVDDMDVQVYWRNWEEDGGKGPANDLRMADEDELCRVGVGAFNAFLGKLRKKTKELSALRWDAVEGKWESIRGARPGQVILLPAEAGGYSDERGWTGELADRPSVYHVSSEESEGHSSHDSNPETFIGHWVTLRDHAEDVAGEARALQGLISSEIAGIPWAAVELAARWHDLGKAHPVFQGMLKSRLDPDDDKKSEVWAKSANPSMRSRYLAPELGERKHFRHELASALAWLEVTPEETENKNLIAFLIAAHHGKVRMSIRSLPTEIIPENPDIRFARGCWDGDVLPEVDLGDGHKVASNSLNLAYMSLGDGPHGASWLSRMLMVLNDYGPFRLAYLESLVRIADWRASEKKTHEAVHV